MLAFQVLLVVNKYKRKINKTLFFSQYWWHKLCPVSHVTNGTPVSEERGQVIPCNYMKLQA